MRPILLSADPALPLPSAYDEDLAAMCRTQAQDYLDDIVEELHEQGVRATGVAALGWNAADSILEVARPERVAAIVIATHGRGGLRRLALGSVTDKVVRGADVPVLVYRPAGAARRRSGRASRVEPRPAGRTRRQAMMYGRMSGLMLVYAAVWIVVVGTVVVALWRGMQAQEKMARHLEAIERSLADRLKAP